MWAPPPGGLIRPFELTDVPDHSGFAWASRRPMPTLEIVPSVEFASTLVTVTPATASGTTPLYYRTGDHITAALRIDYAILPDVTAGGGGRNPFDAEYALTDGSPAQGRSFFVSLRGRY